MLRRKLLLTIWCVFVAIGSVFAQPAGQIVKIVITPDHANWIYRPGEKVKFSGTVLQYGHPLKNVKIVYEVGPEKMDPIKEDSNTLAHG